MLSSWHKENPHVFGKDRALRKYTLYISRILSVEHIMKVTYRRNIAEVSFESHPVFLLVSSNSLLCLKFI